MFRNRFSFFVRRVVVLLSSACVVNAATKVHTCLPSGHDDLCVLRDIFYDSRDTTTQHVFPTNYSMVQITNHAKSSVLSSSIPDFEVKLYSLLGKPPVLEITEVQMKILQIPLSLRHGCFASNSIRKVTVQDEGNSTAALILLDLSHNYISDMTEVRTLINLEVLFLTRNSIYEIEPNVLSPLTKLRYLCLAYNEIHELSGKLYPPSLVDLQLYRNGIESLNHQELDFPSLEVLNVERNYLETIDVTALHRIIPKLKAMYVGGNDFQEKELRAIITELSSRNISFKSDADDRECYYHENVVEGVCLNAELDPMGLTMAIVFSALLVAIGTVFVLAVRWVYRAMDK